MESKKVSIVLPVHNGARYLRRAVNSCLNQTYGNFELIIVDDCSTDDTAAIIGSYRDARLRCLRHRRNRGLPAALNSGFAAAAGDYLTWLSDDNQFLPEAIGEMARFLQGNPQTGIVYCDFWAVREEDGRKELRLAPNVLELERENLMSPCFMYRRKVYESVGDYDIRLGLVEDYDYWIRVKGQFSCSRLPLPLYLYSFHGGSLTFRNYHSVRFMDGLLKYRHRFISRRELGESWESVFRSIFSDYENRSEAVFFCLQEGRRVFRVSFGVGCFFLRSFFAFGRRRAERYLRRKILSYGQ